MFVTLLRAYDDFLLSHIMLVLLCMIFQPPTFAFQWISCFIVKVSAFTTTEMLRISRDSLNGLAACVHHSSIQWINHSIVSSIIYSAIIR